MLEWLPVELSDWIDQQGGYAAAAEKLGESPRAVRSWYYAERAPGLAAAAKIIKVSDYLVDFNGIYWPLALRILGFEKPSK